MALGNWFRRSPDPALLQRVTTAEEQARVARDEMERTRAEVAELKRFIADSPAALGATGQGSRPIYVWDQPQRWATPQTPRRRPETLISVDDLRRLAEVYDVLRACINHLKREVAAVPIKIVARDEEAGAAAPARIKEAEAWFETAGGCGGVGCRRDQFEGQLVEDLCVIGAAAVYYDKARNGQPYQAIAIDSSTIRPIVDAYGWQSPTGPAYEQWEQGRPVRTYSRAELYYDGIYPVTFSPYPKSPVEYLIFTITSALYADEWNRRWLTDGTAPADLIAVPETWTVDDIKSYAEWWDATMTGDIRKRAKVKFVPSGMNKLMNPTRHDQDFQEFEHTLALRVCAIFGVSPAAIGRQETLYKVAQHEALSHTSEFGAGVLLKWRDGLHTDMLARRGYPDLICQSVDKSEEDATSRTARLVAACGGPFLTINEARAQDGREGIPGGDVLLVSSSSSVRSPDDLMPDETQGAEAAEETPADARQTEEHARELSQWRKKALARLRDGRSLADLPFTCHFLPEEDALAVRAQLAAATDRAAVDGVFRRAVARTRRPILERKQFGHGWQARRLAFERSGRAPHPLEVPHART